MAIGLLVACGEPTTTLPTDNDLPPEVPGPTDDGGRVVPRAVGDKIRGGGLDDANNVGSVVGTQWGPSGWQFIQGSATGVVDFQTNLPDACLDPAIGSCQDGNLVQQINGLSAPNNPDANPDLNGNASTLFAVEHVGPFRSREPADAVSRKSGITRTLGPQDPVTFATLPLPDDSGWELEFDWAFLSGNAGTGPANNDYAEVVVSAPGEQPKQVFKISRDDINPQGGSTFTSLQDNSCVTGNTTTYGGLVTTPFLICTGWLRAKIDVSEYRGKLFTIEITTNKVGNESTGTFFAFDNVRLTGIDLPTVPVSLGPIISSPLFLFAGKEVTSYSLIRGGVQSPAPAVSWVWGDGASSPGSVVTLDGFRFAMGTHTYAVPGLYQATASVTAADGATDSRAQPLLVLHRPGAIVLTYICGNRFRVRNYYAGEVRATWSVYRTGDKGTLALPAKPDGSDYSETVFTTGVKGTTLLFLNGILVQTKANGGATCPV